MPSTPLKPFLRTVSQSSLLSEQTRLQISYCFNMCTHFNAPQLIYSNIKTITEHLLLASQERTLTIESQFHIFCLPN